MARSIDEIRRAYNDGEFTTKLPHVSIREKVKKDHVFDENKSVKWNKEQVALQHEEISRKIKERREDQSRLALNLSNEIAEAIQEEYGLNKEQAEIINGYAYSEHHSSMHDYFIFLDEYAALAKKVIMAGAK